MPHDREYVAARRVLLDALDALGVHRKAVVLIGAQAVYLHVGTDDFAVAPYTTDADLAINPRILDDEPLLADALHAAGFDLALKPGTWSRTEVQVDFLVPEAVGGSGRRGARLGPHGSDVARKARGIEAALVDHAVLRIEALDDGDARAFDVAVAGLAALLIAKLHKIAEREAVPDRTVAKDGLDVLRILRRADLEEVGATLARLEQDHDAGLVANEARGHLQRLFSDRAGHGAQLAVEACGGLEDADTIAASCEALAKQLLLAWPSD